MNEIPIRLKTLSNVLHQQGNSTGVDTCFSAVKEIIRLRAFLSIAIDSHEEEHGKVDAKHYPAHWTIMAREVLDE